MKQGMAQIGVTYANFRLLVDLSDEWLKGGE